MAYVRIRDDTLWASHIEGDAQLKTHIQSLRQGAVIELEVDGIVGSWEKMRDGRDGRPTPGIKPIGAMQRVWKQFQERRGELIELRSVQTADRYLASLGEVLSEWDSPEDDEAYHDL